MTPLEREASDLAMLVLQSDLYRANAEVRDSVDAVLALGRAPMSTPKAQPPEPDWSSEDGLKELERLYGKHDNGCWLCALVAEVRRLREELAEAQEVHADAMARPEESCTYDLIRQRDALRAERDQLRAALEAPDHELARCGHALRQLVAQIGVVGADEEYRNVWFVAQLHRGPYAGPTYEREMIYARKVLAAALAQPSEPAPRKHCETCGGSGAVGTPVTSIEPCPDCFNGQPNEYQRALLVRDICEHEGRCSCTGGASHRVVCHNVRPCPDHDRELGGAQ